MNCPDVQRHLPDFLSDLLTETQHHEIREHLFSCANCRDYGFKIYSFPTDLKRIGLGALPFNLTEAVERRLLSLKSHAKNRKNLFRVVLPTALGTAFLAVFVFSFWNPYAHVPPPVSPAPSEAPQEVLQQLQMIDERLKKIRPADEKGSSPVRPFSVAKLEPIHWDLTAADLRAREKLLGVIKRDGYRVEYESPGILVLAVRPYDVVKLRDQITSFLASGTAAPPFDARGIPSSQDDVRVALVLGTPEGLPDAVKHWHFDFLLHNAFNFERRLKDHGFEFIYHTSEFWILKLSAQAYENFMDESRIFPGLKTDPALEPLDAPEGVSDWTVVIHVKS